ncbi:sensor histidine kinase, partial [Micromonospora zhanjiangensis]
ALPRESGGGSVVVAASLAAVERITERTALTLLATGGSLVGLLTVAGWFAVRAGLRPLRRIEHTAAAIAGGDLTNRVPPGAGERTEIGRLSAALNGMLAQLERAFAARAESEARMRRFVADVSHELRTPLFGIRGFTELYRMGGLPTRQDVDRTMARIESESGRLARLAEDLLLLARLDESARPELSPMDLRTLAVDARHDLTALAPERPVILTGPGGQGHPGDAPVAGDEARLRQVVGNLVGNAVAHTPTGTPVRIGVGTIGDSAILEVADAGPGIAAEHAERIFERFFRVDASRNRSTGGGAGLGLAIARSLVAAHGGRLDLLTGTAPGTTFRITLPATPQFTRQQNP